ncbi:MAG: FAD-binding protein [Bacteroidales bacterium]|nr:FAD-binding protein [Bacteroidales bacterium]
MIKELQLRVTPQQAAVEDLLKKHISSQFGIDAKSIKEIRIIKRSIDARQKNVMVNLKLNVYINEFAKDKAFTEISFPSVKDAPQAVVVGAGPAGLFAALRLIELGIKPIIVERGKNVRDRKKDLAMISRSHKVDPESNYSFGEGGAGAYSDGKLYTRSKKRGSVDRILNIFCQFGANESILADAHPHIGTDKLPAVIENIRKKIIECGGEVLFETKMTDIIIGEDNNVEGIIANENIKIEGPVILATGHSARDVYSLLKNKNIFIEAKGIAVGVRLEHPQNVIDKIQYHSKDGRGEWLPAAEYSFVTQVDDRGVYSFCMCPGGVVVPAATGPNQIVVNGMSSSSRGSKWANSGMVVEIRPEDLPDYDKYEELKMMKFQQDLEYSCYVNGNSTQSAPAQRMMDFIEGKISKDLPSSSYAPGLVSSPLHFWIPELISKRLKEGFKVFGRSAKGFLTNEAVMIAIETRTSSPVRIPRDREKFVHPQIKNLYPCGEGAGFAGGIVSAAIDGENCASALFEVLKDKKSK